MLRVLITIAIGIAATASSAQEAKPIQVVPYCSSPVEHMCDIFLEFMDRDPRFDLVPQERRWPNAEFLNIELQAGWVGGSDLQGRIVWWGKSGKEHTGAGAVMAGVPADPRVYVHLVSLSLSGAGLPDEESAFYAYGR